MTELSFARMPSRQYCLSVNKVPYSDFPLTLARWPMASEHCRRTSDFLSYWPGLASGILKIAEK